MNRFKIITLSITICLIGCKSSKGNLEATLLELQQKVVILLNKKYKKIALIELPLKVQLTNNSYSSKTFASIQYKYLPYEKGIGNPLYIEKNNTFIRVKQATGSLQSLLGSVIFSLLKNKVSFLPLVKR
ncbi:hypothetical protein NACSLCCMFF_850001 [Tenacibaculum maritimum]|uniref:hypothetical protein n=1 Tax=Tenacibaculum maritimum TaxID=107401 RepID=UPI0012E6891C|nr:hypothetical protein [Tenacibaculum maritimum]CAA0255827.1 hypothetical protein NACSLCCMFF_850001 [Tenacibaculum maritimum]